MDAAMTFGQRLRQWRERRMLTQAELAARIRVHPSQISIWEADRTRPRLRRQRQLCEALGISADDFFGRPRKVDGNAQE